MSANGNLVAACDKKDVKGAAAALATGASADASNANGMSVLNTACVLKSKVLVKLLVEAGANVNATDKDGRAVLHWLAEYLAEPDLAKLCIQNGANVDALDTKKFSMKSALHRAVSRPKIDFAEALLEGGANIEIKELDRQNTPLMQLCKSQSGAMSKSEITNAKWLIDRGANINATNDSGETPLHAAAGSSREMTQFLLDRGARITTNKWDMTPLYYCFSTNEKDTALWDLLIAAGCDVNHNGERGTVLHDAQSHWNPTGVAYLLSKGADPGLKDADGETPLESAIKLKQEKIILLLESAAGSRFPQRAGTPEHVDADVRQAGLVARFSGGVFDGHGVVGHRQRRQARQICSVPCALRVDRATVSPSTRRWLVE
jgi:uncharacterized protein